MKLTAFTLKYFLLDWTGGDPVSENNFATRVIVLNKYGFSILDMQMFSDRNPRWNPLFETNNLVNAMYVFLVVR